MNKIQDELNYSFNDLSLLERALTHSSFANDNNSLSYERFEFLGDALLELAVSQIIYDKTNLNEGQLTKLRSKLVSENYLQNVCNKLKLTSKIRLGKSITKISNSIKADVVESVIASIYLDSNNNFKNVLEFVEKFIVVNDDNINNVFNQTIDFKTQLQEVLGAGAVLNYELKKKSGPEHMPTFNVELFINNQLVSQDTGSSLKLAEQACAKVALEKIKNRRIKL